MIHRIANILTVVLATTLVAAPTSPAATEGASAAGASTKIADLIGDPVIAKGKGVEIKRSQLDNELLNFHAMISAQGRSVPPEQMQMVEREKLNDLIGIQLILGKATAADKAKGKAQFEKALERLKTNNKLTDAELEEKLAPTLRLQNLSRAQWEQQRIDQATVMAVLERELNVSVTDEEAKKFYEENQARFEQPEQVRASHILIGTRDNATGGELSAEQKQAKRKQIEDLRKRAVAGEDFAQLAKEHSEDPGSKETGGEYVFGRGRMVPEFEAAAFSLNTNQISDVVTTSYGYHIIKLSEKIPAKLFAYAEVAEELKENLRAQELQKQLVDTDYVAKLRKEANVEILDERLKKLDETLPKPEKPAAKPESGK